LLDQKGTKKSRLALFPCVLAIHFLLNPNSLAYAHSNMGFAYKNECGTLRVTMLCRGLFWMN